MIGLRCEAGHVIGYGHLYRSLLLADAMAALGLDCVFLHRADDHEALKIVRGRGHQVFTVPPCESYVQEIVHYPAMVALVLDLCHVNNFKNGAGLCAYLSALSESPYRVAFIDGLFDDAFCHKNPLPTDILIQPYPGAEHDDKTHAKCRIRGAEYTLMDPVYANRAPKNIAIHGQNILITFGGADPQGLTATVLQYLYEDGSKYNYRVIIGPYFSDEHVAVIETIKNEDPDRINVIYRPVNLLESYDWADIAIGSSGLSRYEFAAMGLPGIFVSLYRHHEKLSEIFANYNVAVYLGLFSECNENDWKKAVGDLAKNAELRRTMSKNGQALIDGHGAMRLATRLTEIIDHGN